MSTVSVETCRSSRTDKTTPHTKIPMTKLKDTNLSFQDKEDWSIEMRTKGEVKGGGSERTENETDREIAISTHPLWGCIQIPACTLPERAR